MKMTNYMNVCGVARKFSFILLDQYAISNPFTVIHYGQHFSHSCVYTHKNDMHRNLHTHARERVELIKSTTQTFPFHIYDRLYSWTFMQIESNGIVSIPNHAIWFLFTTFSVWTSGNICFFHRFSSLEPFCQASVKVYKRLDLPGKERTVFVIFIVVTFRRR